MRHNNASRAGGLEVNAYDEGLHFAYNKDALPEVLNPQLYEKRAAQQKFSELPARDEPPRSVRGTTLRLSIALVLAIVFAIVAAALAATMANKLHQVKRFVCRNRIIMDFILKIVDRQLETCNSFPQHNATNGSHTPTSDCTSLTSPYASINNARYNLHCNTDQPNGDLVSIFVYTFEDCMHACSSYAHMGTHPGSTCLGVSYSYTIRAGTTAMNYDAGNCALKAVGYNGTAVYPDVGVDSAFLNA